MLFNIPLTSLALIFSTLLIVNTSPVPNDGLALVDLARRSDTSIHPRDIELERRQKGGAGGAGSAAGAGAGGAGAGAASGAKGGAGAVSP